MCPPGPLEAMDSGLLVWRVCPCPSGCVNPVQWACNADGIALQRLDWQSFESSIALVSHLGFGPGPESLP